MEPREDCLECQRWRDEGARFCMACGNPLFRNEPEDCPDCAVWRGRGARYCMSCGRPLSAAKPADDGPRYPVFYWCTIFCAFLAAVAIIFGLAYDIVEMGAMRDALQRLGYGFEIQLGLAGIRVFSVEGDALFAYAVFVVALTASFFAYAAWRFLTHAKERAAGGDYRKVERSGLTALSTILCVSLAVSVVYFLLMAATGNNADSSWLDKYSEPELAFLFSSAGFVEEMEFRVFWIGLPMMIVALLWFRDRHCWQYLLGGFGMSRVAVLFLIVSSTIFGLAHYDGWGWVKIADAAFAGVLFGYVYIEYGLYASVLMHFANDMLSATGWLVGSGIESLLFVTMILAGAGIIVYWLLKPNMDAVDVRRMPWFNEKLEGGIMKQWGRR